MDALPRRIGGYDVERWIRRGRFAATAQGRSAQGDKVAIKWAFHVPRETVPEGTEPVDLCEAYAFATGTTSTWDVSPSWVVLQEAAVLDLLGPGPWARVVDLFDDPQQGRKVLVTAWIEGRPLLEQMRDYDSARLAIVGAARALAEVEIRGRTFGDVKPSNIIVAPDGSVKLIDPAAMAIRRDVASGAIHSALVTPAYCPTLQPSDVLSLGVTLLECVLGGHPLEGNAAGHWKLGPGLAQLVRFRTGRTSVSRYPSIPRCPSSDRQRLYELGLACLGLAVDGDRLELREPIASMADLCAALEDACELPRTHRYVPIVGLDGDRFARSNLNHLRDDPAALERRYDHLQRNGADWKKAHRLRQREKARAVFERAGFDVDAVYAAEDAELAKKERAAAEVAERTKREEALVALSLRLLRCARDQAPEGNLVVSPYSVLQALAMVMLGARGQTLKELVAALGWPDADRLVARIAAERRALDDLTATTDGVSITGANSVWIDDQDVRVDASYVGALRDLCDSELRVRPIRRQAPSAAEAINAWVSEQTDAMIPSLVDADMLRASLMVLVNAILLRARWESPFDSLSTRTGPFTLESGETTSVEFMSQSGVWNFSQVDGLDVVTMDYRGDALCMGLFVPREQSLTDLVDSLTAAALKKLLTGVQPSEAILRVPRFEIELRLDLAQLLTGIGLGGVFDPSADLSGIGETTLGEPLYFGSAVHEARLRVDEDGTVAAAASAVLVAPTGPPAARSIPTISIDQPFLLVLFERHTGVIVFVAEVRSPPPAPADPVSADQPPRQR